MRKLSASSTLDNLRKEAKRWLGAIRACDVSALERLHRVLPRHAKPTGLRDVQHALALEHGLANWSTLKAALSEQRSSNQSIEQQAAELLEYACIHYGIRAGTREWDRSYNDHPSRPRHAARLLKRNPDIARYSIHTAVVCGDLAEVQRRLREEASIANEKGGLHGWEPILYLCYGRLPTAAAGEQTVAIARALLDANADLSVCIDQRGMFLPLTGVIGEGEGTALSQPPHPRAHELAALLIERGADPYDPQALYNTSLGDDDLFWLDFLHGHSQRLGKTQQWTSAGERWPQASMMDYLLGNAVGGNHLRRAHWLLQHGARAGAANYYSKRALHTEAVLYGFRGMADLLERSGAQPEVLQGHDAFQAACMRMDRAAANLLVEQHPEFLLNPTAMLKAATLDRVDVVALLLDLGMSPDVEDRANGCLRPLHAAARSDALPVATLLVERGAMVDAVETLYGSTPLGWALYFEQTRVAELLASVSRNVLALVGMGNTERLRVVLATEPQLAQARDPLHAPLFSLPEDDDVAAEVAELLLQHGADPLLRNREALTAIEYNTRRGLDATAAVLRKAVQSKPPARHTGSTP